MAQYRDNVEVQRAGCRALANLALGDVRNILTTSGASSTVIETVVNSMRLHPDDEVVQEFSCWSLAYITWSSNEAKMCARAACACAAGSRRRVAGDAEPRVRRRYAREVGAPSLLRSAMQRFPKVDGVQKQSKLALWKINEER